MHYQTVNFFARIVELYFGGFKTRVIILLKDWNSGDNKLLLFQIPGPNIIALLAKYPQYVLFNDTSMCFTFNSSLKPLWQLKTTPIGDWVAYYSSVANVDTEMHGIP